MNETITTQTLLPLLLKGGWVMLPIIILSIFAIYIIIDRCMALKKANSTPIAWLEEVEAMLYLEDIKNIKALCHQRNSAIQRMVGTCIDHLGKPRQNMEAVIEDAGKQEIYALEKKLPLLGTIAGAAPMIGFLGTVLGMIQTFMAIAGETGHVSPQLLSEGIYKAMITTASGLIVGIIAYIGYNYLLTCIEQVAHSLEITAREFLELCKFTKKGAMKK